ncbi:MAG: hypothetical protein Q4D96_11125 [Propionibacteriaceae bacterium]|nr:hypothetical protein [Propionibacteriaceae bacterium]
MIEALFTHTRQPEEVAARIAALDDAGREEAAKEFAATTSKLRTRLVGRGQAQSFLVLLAHLPITPAQAAKALNPELLQIGHAPVVAQGLRAKGADWVAAFIRSACAVPRLRADLARLVDDLITEFDLPLPDAPDYWRGWYARSPLPRPGVRWQQRFLTACLAPELFAPNRRVDEQRIARAVEKLRASEPTDDAALLSALLQVFERGDRTNTQRVAAHWVSGLGLTALFWEHRRRVIDALPAADASFVKLALAELLTPELPEADLDALAVVVMPRAAKGVLGQVVKSLGRLKAPSADLRDTVAALAPEHPAAAKLLTGWGEAAAAPERLGLWREPAGVAEPDARHADLEADLGELMDELPWEQPKAWDHQEVWLAQLFHAAHARGREALFEFAAENLDARTQLTRVLLQVATGEEPGTLGERPLTSLIGRRMRETLPLLGLVPVPLSIPTLTGNRLDWVSFAERATAFREATLPLSPTDVLVALSRMDRSAAPVDVTELDQPIDGVESSLAEVVACWRDTDPEPGRLWLIPEEPDASRWQNLPYRRLRCDGDVPVVAGMLGIDGPWVEPSVPLDGECSEELGVMSLLPEHPTRPAAHLLQVLGREGTLYHHGPDSLAARLLTTARITPEAAFAILATVTKQRKKDREEFAALLLNAWDEGRLHPSTLVAAWRSEWKSEWPLKPIPLVGVLVLIAEAGGLALAWPLLEELGPAAKAARDALERFRPEVP